MHVEADDRVVRFWPYFRDHLDLDTADALTVERHALRWLEMHDRPFDSVGHALDFDDRLDDGALFQLLGQLAPPPPVDGQPLLEAGQVRRTLPRLFGRQWHINGYRKLRHESALLVTLLAVVQGVLR